MMTTTTMMERKPKITTKMLPHRRLELRHRTLTSNIGSDDLEEESEDEGFWVLKVRKKVKVRVRISTDMQLKFFGEQMRVDFVDRGVWVLKILLGG
ncbi:hypothetical protein ACH5RR_002244 [Cinchona calisaya]|uniref:DUF7135 domain-containing protein n=1 Tax=Cinchona calisaya TaxID=153742 RepID=A0ABD3B6L2_9GENT